MQHTPERWDAPTVRDVLEEHAKEVLAWLDAMSCRRGVEPTTATIGFLLDLGAQVAWVALVNAGEQPSRAEASLTRTGVKPSMLSRRLERSGTVTVRPSRADP